MTTSDDRIDNYADFFLFYLREHRLPVTRAFHYVAAFATLAMLAAAFVTGIWWLALLMPLAGYGPAWVSHFFLEKNRPATFRYPLWSLISDYYMTGLWLTGGLSAKLAEAGVGTDGRLAQAD